MSFCIPPFFSDQNVSSNSQNNDRFIPSRKRNHSASTYFELESLENETSTSKLIYKRTLLTTLFNETHIQPVLKLSNTLDPSRSFLSLRTLKRKNLAQAFNLDAIPPRAGIYKYPISTDTNFLYYIEDSALYIQNPFDLDVGEFQLNDKYCSITAIPNKDNLLLGTADGSVSLKSKESFTTIKNTIFDLGQQICVMKPISPDFTYISTGSGIFGAYDLRIKKAAFRKQLQNRPITGISENSKGQVAIGYEDEPWALYDVRSLNSPLFEGEDKTTFGRNVVFCPDNSDLLATTEEKTILIWQISRQAENIHAFEVNDVVTTLDWVSQNELQLTKGEIASTLEHWIFPTETKPWTCIGHVIDFSAVPTILQTKPLYDADLTLFTSKKTVTGIRELPKIIQKNPVPPPSLLSGHTLR